MVPATCPVIDSCNRHHLLSCSAFHLGSASGKSCWWPEGQEHCQVAEGWLPCLPKANTVGTQPSPCSGCWGFRSRIPSKCSGVDSSVSSLELLGSLELLQDEAWWEGVKGCAFKGDDGTPVPSCVFLCFSVAVRRTECLCHSILCHHMS